MMLGGVYWFGYVSMFASQAVQDQGLHQPPQGELREVRREGDGDVGRRTNDSVQGS